VSQFLEQNHIENKDLRFNFFIDRQIYNYLRWASFKTGKTKAEILRELVLHDIERQDYRP
jgi:predicted DNA-binding protein